MSFILGPRETLNCLQVWENLKSSQALRIRTTWLWASSSLFLLAEEAGQWAKSPASPDHARENPVKAASGSVDGKDKQILAQGASRTELSRSLWCKQKAQCQCVLESGLKWPFLAVSIKNTKHAVTSTADMGCSPSSLVKSPDLFLFHVGCFEWGAKLVFSVAWIFARCALLLHLKLT